MPQTSTGISSKSQHLPVNVLFVPLQMRFTLKHNCACVTRMRLQLTDTVHLLQVLQQVRFLLARLRADVTLEGLYVTDAVNLRQVLPARVLALEQF